MTYDTSVMTASWVTTFVEHVTKQFNTTIGTEMYSHRILQRVNPHKHQAPSTYSKSSGTC